MNNYALKILKEERSRIKIAEYPNTDAIQDLQEAIDILTEILPKSI
jgi:hypothetical protein